MDISFWSDIIKFLTAIISLFLVAKSLFKRSDSKNPPKG